LHRVDQRSGGRKAVDTPKPGDVIYVDTDLYVWHGVDDFRGGKAIGSSCAGGEER